MKHAALGCALCAVLVAGAASAAGPPSGTVRGRILVDPLAVNVFVPAGPMKAGKDFAIRASVANTGPNVVENIAVTLVVTPVVVLRQPPTQVVRRLGRASVADVLWDACAAGAGGYVVMARASSGPFTVESTGQVVQVTAVKKAAC